MTLRLMESMRVIGDEICYRAKDRKYLNNRAEHTFFFVTCLFLLSISFRSDHPQVVCNAG